VVVVIGGRVVVVVAAMVVVVAVGGRVVVGGAEVTSATSAARSFQWIIDRQSTAKTPTFTEYEPAARPPVAHAAVNVRV